MTAEERAAQAERDLDLLRHLYNESLHRQQEAIRAAVLEERAACADLVYQVYQDERLHEGRHDGCEVLRDAIRARSEP